MLVRLPVIETRVTKNVQKAVILLTKLKLVLKENSDIINVILYPADTQRCFNVDSTLKFGRDVVQPIFNQSRLSGSLGLTVNVDSTLNQR